ncbi:Hca4p helicase DBP4 (helicase CA4) EIF4A-1-family RNA SFII helicase [Cryptosporidium ryanae]|uniref:Hca4p helicase DBP4 (helicase CA4) EIF4A-1-family RNA SFII helicase n=1 Tax=Cryptosporidium ryanae TaxID=515981 RepID=UPI00351A79CE|nr:Hca4p helicase DBP4 (helicase CA4) EIF4A-1-family RNA SFII helicase [Cryptosporidium ryanae]
MRNSKVKLKKINKYNDDLEIKTLRNRVVIELPNNDEIWKNPNIRELETGSEGSSNEKMRNSIMTYDLFSDLPISRRTIEGLKSCGYNQMTLIQKFTLPYSLQGRDVIGQARTGSGKTLAYLIPILENIYRRNYCSSDGLLALVIAPTRELASQIFDIVKEIGKFHSSLSAGCIVGGKDIKSEATRINLLNILIATPGRLIQHMDESPLWNSDNLMILVIDEVDRMLDMGFSKDIEIILEGIPKPKTGRQTMVFSATIEPTEIMNLESNPRLFDINNLKKCSLDDIGILPNILYQLYIYVPIEEKIDTLFNFVRTHSNKKMIVFVSCCKQVRYFHTVFSKLKLGCKVLELHGKQSLQKRLEVVHKFHLHTNKMEEKNRNIKNLNTLETNERSKGIVLFCTDIASRGLDFPQIDWVIQLDIPDSVDTYIHRIGRTARCVFKGRSLMFAMPNEKYFIDSIVDRGFKSLKRVESNFHEMRFTINSTLQILCASDPSIRVLAEKAFSAYVKSCFILAPPERREELKKLDFPAFSISMGLVIPPKIKFNQISEESQKNKNIKQSTKLQRFKEKLRQRKLLKQESQDKFENRTDSSEYGLNSEQSLKETLDEDCIVSVSQVSIGNNEESSLIKKDERKIINKLKFRSDFSGKIRGHREFEFEKKHVFFSDDDKEKLDYGIKFSSSEEDTGTGYFERIKNRLKSQTEGDKNRDRERVHNMHVKKRRVLRERRKLEIPNELDISYGENYLEDSLSDGSRNENKIEDLASEALKKLGIKIHK